MSREPSIGARYEAVNQFALPMGPHASSVLFAATLWYVPTPKGVRCNSRSEQRPTPLNAQTPAPACDFRLFSVYFRGVCLGQRGGAVTFARADCRQERFRYTLLCGFHGARLFRAKHKIHYLWL